MHYNTLFQLTQHWKNHSVEHAFFQLTFKIHAVGNKYFLMT